jgi:acetyltransferase-like isoleucine patch superfamily enzyme
MIRPLADFLYRAYAADLAGVRRAIRLLVRRFDGGEFRSTTLRRIFTDYHRVTIGLYSYGGCFKVGRIAPGTRIGRYGSFADFWVFSRNHPLDHISMHPYFYNPALGFVASDMISSTQLTIGHDVWIGLNAIVLPRVTQIGNGAVIAAGSVVTTDVPPYAVMAGNPARLIKHRFQPDLIEALERAAWWNRSIEELTRHLGAFTRPLSGAHLLDLSALARGSHDDPIVE